MTVEAVGHDPPVPLALPVDYSLSHPEYGFFTETWKENPVANGPDWFSDEERSRRNANLHAYRQFGNSTLWNRFVTLGFFSYSDCLNFDKLWERIAEDPLSVHRAIWYNFMFHVDRNLDIPAELNTWVMNITHAYLFEYDNSFLDLNTLNFPNGISSLPKVSKSDTWTEVHGRRRSKSPPVGALAPGFNPGPSPVRHKPQCHTKDQSTLSTKHHSMSIRALFEKKKKTVLDKPPLLPVTTVFEEDDDEVMEERRGHYDPTHQLTRTPLNSHINIATNDGTHRLTVKWTSPDDIRTYEKDKAKLNNALLTLIQAIIADEDGVFYRWESEDLLHSKASSSLSLESVRDFVSPTVTFLPSRSQMVFGIRFGFMSNPTAWHHSSDTKQALKVNKLEINISNSKSTSGKLVIAGYLLLKAPNTTHRHRYTQFLRSQVPEATPFFDIVRFKKTPMDQLIPHLAIQCGEKQVATLCQALLKVLTGKGVSLFLPRYAFRTMSNDQVRNHFIFHQTWTRSLKSIPMDPIISHLDQIRVEYHNDGTITERSTREWISTLTIEGEDTPALCDGVNGTNDRHAFLLYPSHYQDQARTQWYAYKSRLYPPSHREARFLDSVPGLPDEIHIQQEVASNISFLEYLSAADIWKQAPTTVRQDTPRPTPMPVPPSFTRSGYEFCPTQILPPPKSRYQKQGVERVLNVEDQSLQSIGRASTDMEDRSTASTQSITLASQVVDRRIRELSVLIKQQQSASEAISKESTTRFSEMDHQFSRINDLDSKMTVLSTDVLEIKEQNRLQYQESRAHMVDAMENHHLLATNMLTIRSEVSTLSGYIKELADKLEKALTRQTQPIEYTRGMTSKPAAPAFQVSSSTTASISSGGSKSSQVSSNASQATRASITSSTCYVASPEKKKGKTKNGKFKSAALVPATHEDTIVPWSPKRSERKTSKSSDSMDLCTDQVYQFHDTSPSRSMLADSPMAHKTPKDFDDDSFQTTNILPSSQASRELHYDFSPDQTGADDA